MKFDNSAANEREAIAFSSIVCIELNMKKLEISTTSANILASNVMWNYFKVSKKVKIIISVKFFVTISLCAKTFL